MLSVVIPKEEEEEEEATLHLRALSAIVDLDVVAVASVISFDAS